MISSAESLISAVRALVGLRWSHQGRSTSDGADCVGLIVLSAKSVGWEPRDPAAIAQVNYRRESQSDKLRDLLRTEGQEVTFEELQPGDVILWDFQTTDYPQHVGLLTRVRPHYVIHADVQKGRVVEHALTGKWRRAFVAGYRFWELVSDE